MQFDEAEAVPLKAWLIARLEDISDADSDVLGDYVLALVRSEEPEDDVRVSCVAALEDFLGDHTQKFVEDVFVALRTKSYMPGYVAPHLSQPTQTALSAFGVPAGSSGNQGGSIATFNNGSRKRGFRDPASSEPADRRESGYGERAQKQLRRGNQRGGPYNGRDARSSYEQPIQGGYPKIDQFPAMATMPPNMPGFPALDPNNPMAALMAMQSMGFPPLPGFSPLSGTDEQRLPGSVPATKMERCRDYDIKGFCAAGSMCPYEHGSDHIVAPGSNEEYDPRNPLIPANFTSSHMPKSRQFESTRPTRGGRGGRGNQNGGMAQNPRGRAAFSSAMPNNDRNVTTIVVEQIPEEKFSEEAVRAFFSEFGEIEEVTMQAYRRLAIVKYADFSAARRAYDSPKVIFDNRFVKVYWYKPDTLPTPRSETGFNGPVDKQEPVDEPMIDLEAFAIKQGEAQRLHEEKARKLKEAAEQKAELDRRVKAQAEERRLLLEKLAKRTGASAASISANANGNGAAAATTTTDKKPASGQTDALRAKLAELEAEAETLGISPNEDPNAASYPYYRGGRGRAGYIPRGRGSGFPPRGRGRGGGAWAGFAGTTGAVARLDNRPKNVSVVAADGNVDFDTGAAAESLRGFLFGVGEFGAISTAAASVGTGGDAEAKANRAVVRFNERYVAEAFIQKAGAGEGIPGIGKVELAWVANAPVAMKLDAGAVAFVPGGGAGAGAAMKKEDVEMGDAGDANTGVKHEREMDYDVADDDDDRWGR